MKCKTCDSTLVSVKCPDKHPGCMVAHMACPRCKPPASNAPKFLVRRLPHGEDLPLPSYATDGAAGIDLYAAVERPSREFHIPRNMAYACPTGYEVAIPDGHVGLVLGRSGLAFNRPHLLCAHVGTIDADYRGEIKVLLWSVEGGATLNRGDRIAQLVIMPVVRCAIEEVGELPPTARGSKGYGSTGR